MANISNYAANKLRDFRWRGISWTPPATEYFGLVTSEPVVSDTGSTIDEPSTSGTAYARVAVSSNTTNWSGVTNGQVSNLAAITFPEATASWGTVTHYVILDSATAGNLLEWGEIEDGSGNPLPRAIASGTTMSAAIGQIVRKVVLS